MRGSNPKYINQLLFFFIFIHLLYPKKYICTYASPATESYRALVLDFKEGLYFLQ